MRPALRSVLATSLRPLKRITPRHGIRTGGRARRLPLVVLAVIVSAGGFAGWGLHYFLSTPRIDRAVAIEIGKSLGANASSHAGAEESATPLEAFYRARKFEPVWIRHGAPDQKAFAVVRYLAGVDREGLEPADYAVPETTAGMQPAALARYELALSSAVLKFAHDVRHGRVPAEPLGKNVGYELDRPDQDNVLQTIAAAARPEETLASLAPPQAGYRALRRALAALRSGDPDLSILDKRRLPDRAAAADIVIANMERWRWMPRDLGRSHATANIPAFTLSLVDDGRETFKARIVVGMQSLPTPVMSQSISSITINPLWRVPAEMARREIIPAMMTDPSVVDRLGLKIAMNKDGSLRFFQPPGKNNALGRIRINFPNKYLIYQHDTPDKYLFDLDVRTFSHGCMRVQDPVGYAVALLAISQPDEDYTRARLRGLFGDEPVDIRLKTPVPVHLTYQTAVVDSAGRLVLRDDIYSVDSRMLTLLHRNQEFPGADRLAAQTQ